MYQREERIAEENLDWGELTEASNDNQDKLIEELNEESVQEPVSEPKEIFLDNRNIQKTGLMYTLKNELSDFLKQYAEISLLFGIIFIPYALGFAISYFLFYFYGGMSLNNFLSVQQVPSTIELWSIGAYLLITVGTVLAFFVP